MTCTARNWDVNLNIKTFRGGERGEVGGNVEYVFCEPLCFLIIQVVSEPHLVMLNCLVSSNETQSVGSDPSRTDPNKIK